MLNNRLFHECDIKRTDKDKVYIYIEFNLFVTKKIYNN